MFRRNLFLVVTFVVAIIAFYLLRQTHGAAFSSVKDAFRDTTHVIFTKHAKCRMDCRHINKTEINEIISKGDVNYSKSGRGTKGDETYALEGFSYEHQHLRIVLAPESDGLLVITCIDLDKEWPCNCY